MTDDILFYCGLNERDWNHHPITPGSLACIAPVYGKTQETKAVNRVYIPDEVQSIIVDSGAFSDTTDIRLSFEESLHRQIAHAAQWGYTRKIGHIASYDLLIDEKWINGERSKIRWSKDDAEFAVRQTVLAARYLADKRTALQGLYEQRVGLVLSAQGVEVEQYLRCTQQIVPLMADNDIFGLGGWCITGLLPDVIMPSFKEIMPEVISFLGSQGVKRVHIWGVIFPRALGHLLYLCNQHGIQLSTDSSGPCRYPIMGNWGYGSWRDNAYKTPPILSSCKARNADEQKAPLCEHGTFCRGLERGRHVTLTREWLANFRSREPRLYQPIVKPAYKQIDMWDLEESA